MGAFGMILMIQLFISICIGKPSQLKFNSNGRFKIVQFTDLHFGENEKDDEETTQLMKLIINIEEPDLVAVTGDVVSDYSWDGTRGWTEIAWKRFIRAFAQTNTTYAVTLGNHDKGDLNRREIAELDSLQPNSLTFAAMDFNDHASTFVLTINSSTGNEPVSNLWFLDSGDEDCLGIDGWDCIGTDQLDWYRDKSNQFKKQNNRTIPGLVFTHIPLPEFMSLYNFHDTFGDNGEGAICCSSQNTGVLSTFRIQGDIISVHVGHDHLSNWWGDYFGITLAYGQHTGYSGYHWPGFPHGARVIELTEQPFKMDHWLRLSDGFKVSSQPRHKPSNNSFARCCGSELVPRSDDAGKTSFWNSKFFTFLIPGASVVILAFLFFNYKRRKTINFTAKSKQTPLLVQHNHHQDVQIDIESNLTLDPHRIRQE